MKPRIGITTDVADGRYLVGRQYADLVASLGGLPLLLPPLLQALEGALRSCEGFILTGGDDPRTEQWGVPTHPRARPMDRDRQAFELALLDRLDDEPGRPALGVCLGMQLMALHAGGHLDQHLPESLATADQHWGKVEHTVEGSLGAGIVHSHHRQAITDPGSMRVVATAPDGVIEAVQSPDRSFYLGVQWHCERTADPRLGRDLIAALVAEAAKRPFEKSKSQKVKISERVLRRYR